MFSSDDYGVGDRNPNPATLDSFFPSTCVFHNAFISQSNAAAHSQSFAPVVNAPSNSDI